MRDAASAPKRPRCDQRRGQGGCRCSAVNVPRGTTLERINLNDSGGHPGAGGLARPLQPDTWRKTSWSNARARASPCRHGRKCRRSRSSSRLYVENGARYMTATLMCNSDTGVPRTTAVTFILSGHRLVTVRYDEPKPFAIVGAKLARALSVDRLRRDRHDGPARCRDRSRRRHPGKDRRRRRCRLPRHPGVRRRREPHPQLQGDSQVDRPQGRPHLQSAREPGLDRPACCSISPPRPTA